MTRRAFPKPDVLVAYLPTPADLEIARREHWYRIRARAAPAALATTRWIAFYLPAAFGEQKWSVQYLAPVEGTQVVRRRELLPNELDHRRADDDYVRVAIGEVRRLDLPIPSLRRRRIVFIPTTLGKLQAAREINDLYHESPIEDALWSELRRNELWAERQLLVEHPAANYVLDFALTCERRNVDVECDGDTWHSDREAIATDNERNNRLEEMGWSVLRFNTAQLQESQITYAVDRIRATVEQNGGLALPSGARRVFGKRGESADQLRLL